MIPADAFNAAGLFLGAGGVGVLAGIWYRLGRALARLETHGDALDMLAHRVLDLERRT